MNARVLTKDHGQDTYAPYRKEAFTCLIIDIVVAVSLTLLLLLARAGWFLPIILPLYVLLTVLVNHRTVLRARREAKEGAFETVTVEVTDVRATRTPAGWGGAILRELYPKALRAGRYRIFCRTADGASLVLVCIMSEEKGRMIREAIDRGQMKESTLTYGARSKILRGFEGNGGLTESLNRKF